MRSNQKPCAPELEAETDRFGGSSDDESVTTDGIPDNFMGVDVPLHDGDSSELSDVESNSTEAPPILHKPSRGVTGWRGFVHVGQIKY